MSDEEEVGPEDAEYIPLLRFTQAENRRLRSEAAALRVQLGQWEDQANAMRATFAGLHRSNDGRLDGLRRVGTQLREERRENQRLLALLVSKDDEISELKKGEADFLASFKIFAAQSAKAGVFAELLRGTIQRVMQLEAELEQRDKLSAFGAKTPDE